MCPGLLRLYCCEKILFHHGNVSDGPSWYNYVQKTDVKMHLMLNGSPVKRSNFLSIEAPGLGEYYLVFGFHIEEGKRSDSSWFIIYFVPRLDKDWQV